MRRPGALQDLSRLLTTLREKQLPSIGFLSAFPEAFGLPSSRSSQSRRQSLQPDLLQQKVELLVRSGEETRLALQRWRALEERYFGRPHDLTLWIEEAALRLRHVALLDDEDPLDLGDAASSSSEDARAEAERRLHSIAAKVAGSSPGGVLRLIGPLAEQPAGPRDDLEELQLRHISQVIHGDLKYRQEPYEWVYDGLSPLFLDSVLQTSKGMHISLAALYCAVGRRLNVTLIPEIAPSADASHAAIQAGLSLAVAPAPDPWLLCLDAGQQSRGRLFLDPTTASILDSQQCAAAFPTLEQGGSTSPLPFWTGLMRVAMTAHQRRGDGDAVAHCLYQVLALDINAPEWATALQPAAIRA